MGSESKHSPDPYLFEEILCPHHSGAIEDYREPTPNHHPVSKEDVAELLRLAAQESAKNKRQVAKIQLRLGQGIPGMICPRPSEGPVAQKLQELGATFTAEYHKGDDPDLVDRIKAILQ